MKKQENINEQRADFTGIEVFERINICAFEIDVNKTIIELNDKAKKNLSIINEIVIENKKFKMRNPKLERKISLIVKRIFANVITKPNFDIKIQDKNGNLMYQVAFFPCKATKYSEKIYKSFEKETRLLVAIIDHPKTNNITANDLVSFYGFTKSESMVAILLISGLSANQISHVLRTSIHTVRSHLKAIFRKTGATSQIQVISRICSDQLLPWSLWMR